MKTIINPLKSPKIFYRYVLSFSTSTYGNLDCIEYDLFKETPKGYWIKEKQFPNFFSYKDTKKWISKTSRKRYAYPTKKEACDSYIIRTSIRVGILIEDTKVAATSLIQSKKLIKTL